MADRPDNRLARSLGLWSALTSVAAPLTLSKTSVGHVTLGTVDLRQSMGKAKSESTGIESQSIRTRKCAAGHQFVRAIPHISLTLCPVEVVWLGVLLGSRFGMRDIFDQPPPW